MKRHILFWLCATVILIFVLGGCLLLSEIHEPKAKINLRGEVIMVDVADSNVRRARGLSGKMRLLENSGMLFILPEGSQEGIWMKDMNFPIDIVWLDNSFHVIDTRERVEPSTYPEVFTPRLPARFIIELPSGWVSSHNVTISDTVTIQ